MLRLFHKSLHVKPVISLADEFCPRSGSVSPPATEFRANVPFGDEIKQGDDQSKWLVIWHTPLGAFLDEMRRYGLAVAWHNLKETLR